MFLSEAMPARTYEMCIRPTMAPPAVPHEIAGKHNTDHGLLRKALLDLEAALPDPQQELIVTDTRLAQDRERLLLADLSDIDQHAWAAEKLIGTAKSLDHRGQRGAVEVLRDMHLARLHRYAAWLSHPAPFDRIVRHRVVTSPTVSAVSPACPAPTLITSEIHS